MYREIRGIFLLALLGTSVKSVLLASRFLSRLGEGAEAITTIVRRMK